jgi:hypothetical protein
LAGKSLSLHRHAHGCRSCHFRYEDACERPNLDGLCTTCRGGHAWQLLIVNAEPKQCCLDTARLATKEERDTYKLAGTHLWFICLTCKRTHPFDPRRDPRNPYQQESP